MGDFPKGSGYKGGFRPRCKVCHVIFNNKFHDISYFREWRQANRSSIRAYAKKYSKKPDQKVKKLARTRNRQAQKLKATPAWADQRYIRLFYEGAKIEEARINGKVVVDHIVPLSHPLVCGLHCEQNLQLLTNKHNLLKSNKFSV